MPFNASRQCLLLTLILTGLTLGGCATEDRLLPAIFDRPTPPPPATTGEPVADGRRSGRVAIPGEETRPRPEQPELYPGATRPSQPASRATGPLGARLQGDAVTLNFVNADVREVAKVVLGDLLGLNFVVDPQAQGTVTVQTNRPIPRSELLATLEVVLRASGFDLSETQGVYRVQALADGHAGRAGTRGAVSRALGGGGSIVVAPLRYASAAELRRMLESVVPNTVAIQADATRNQLVIAGPRDDIAIVADLVDSFDVDWLAGTSYALYPLQSGLASTLARDLERIFGDGEQGPAAGVVRIVPIERMNAILVISTSTDYLARAREWIDRLDRGGDEENPSVHVYHVQNNRAADLAAVLAELFSSGDVRSVLPVTSPSIAQSDLQAPAASRRSGGGTASDRTGESTTQPSQQQPATGQGAPSPSTTAPPPDTTAQRRPATGVVTPLLGLDALGRGSQQRPPIRIVADEKNNALVIYARPRDYRMVEAAVRRLDVMPQQVVIEATIVEVTLNDELRYGLQWFFRSGQFEAILTQATNPIAPINPGFNFTFTGGSARVILSALSDLTDLNIVSSPQVLVLDHQTATLQVGDQVPVPVQQARSVTDPDSPLVNSIEYRDTGVILRVTPRVNMTGQIIMEIVQEASEVGPTTSSEIDAPTISQRRIVSTVSVQNGETVALGGLIRDGTRRGRTGIPVLSDIPVLGFLFGTRTLDRARTELLVLLTPRAIRTPTEARAMTEELRNRLSTIRARWPR